jgi:nucleoside-diphosphate-sugar epimerase
VEKVLIFGTGRVGNALNFTLASTVERIENVSSRLTLTEINKSLGGGIMSFQTIIWAGRDAGLPTNPDNSSVLFCDLLQEIERTCWRGYFVFLSSAGEIYGEVRNLPAQETDDISPISNYGKLKAKHENLLFNLAKKDSLRVLVIRISNIYEVSFDDPGIVGALLRSALLGDQFKLQGGHQVRDFIALTDLIISVHKLVSHQVVGVYNVATGHSISIDELVAKIEDLTMKTITATRGNKGVGINCSRISIRKLEELLKWKPNPIEYHLQQMNKTILGLGELT